jgi:hypothetical protein
VAVVGTGASAIQFVPEVAKVARHVDVYQRSAPYVLPKPDAIIYGTGFQAAEFLTPMMVSGLGGCPLPEASGRPDHTFLYRYRGPALRPRRVPGQAEAAGRGLRQRGMSARRVRGELRVPPAVMRLGVRQLGRRCLDPALPWPVQRTRLDQLTRRSLLPRGTAVVRQAIAGCPPRWCRPAPGIHHPR